jgi:flagellar FliL protein
MGPGAAASATEGTEVSADAEPEYDLGEVLIIDSISINLQGGHYLRLGLGLQLVAGAGGSHGAIEPSKALDAAIALYSGLTTEELADLEFREQLKDDLAETLKEAYHEEVVDVYYTDFVTQ